MKIAVAIVLFGLVAAASAVTLTSTCGKPTGGNAYNSTGAASGFSASLCAAAEYSAMTVQCGGPDGKQSASPVVFNYKTKDADQAGPLFFQVIPAGYGVTTSTTLFHVKAEGPGIGTFSIIDYKQESDSINNKQPLKSGAPIVGWIDAEHTYNYVAGTDVTFTVSCSGNAKTESFTYALWNSAETLSWSSTGSAEGTYGAASTAGVPCCGPVQVSWALNGEATEHVYIEAKVTQVAGKWAEAEMDNVSGFDDTQPFGNNGYGSAKVRTCVTNQSCTTEAKVYYISATTAPSNDVDGWVTLELTLRASAGAVGVSVATLAVLLSHLF